MVHGKKRIPYWIDRRLTGLAGPEYHAIISFGLPIEPEDSQYGKSRRRWYHLPSPSLHQTGQYQEPSFDGLNRHGKLRYSWAVDLKAAG